MSLSIGIVGLPNVGKSTLFNALTLKGVPAENYPFCTIEPSEEERKAAQSLHLLTQKPVLYVLNRKSGVVNVDAEGGNTWKALQRFLEDSKAEWVFVDAGVEGELRDVHDDERDNFRRELGVPVDGLDGLIKAGYRMLNLISFFTTGEDETRAWTITKGSTAPEAGAVIHTDFRDKFIRADVIQTDKLLEVGSFAKAREQGLLRSEGREYVMNDGDVVEFKHS